MTVRRVTPSTWSRRRLLATVDVAPEHAEHPRIGEYLHYAGMLRFPKPFAEWLRERERIEAGKTVDGARLQELMDSERYYGTAAKLKLRKGKR